MGEKGSISLFSRKLAGYRVSRKCSVQLVSSTFKKAFQNRGRPFSLTFHSDRGGQYISGAFCALLRKCEVKQSFSKSGCPHDNAVAEAFFRHLREKRLTAMNILRKQISEKAWKHMSTFTTMFAPIRPWRTRLRRDLKSCTEKKKHRIYEKSRV